MGTKRYGLTKREIVNTRNKFLSGEISFDQAMSLLSDVYAVNKNSGD